MYSKTLLFATVLLASGSVMAQAPDWSGVKRVEIDMASYKYLPAEISLHHGRSYVLHFTNTSGKAHNFVAKAFFVGAVIAPRDRAAVEGGEVELSGGQSADVRLIAPASGTYEVHCSHFLHTTLGMKGTIIVT